MQDANRPSKAVNTIMQRAESNRRKADRRRADAAEVSCGNAKAVQARNRLVPPELLVFPDSEDALPTENDPA